MSNALTPKATVEQSPGDSSRREFVAGSAAAMLAAITGTAGVDAVAADALIGQDVQIPMADGKGEAAFFHPNHGAFPGVILWTDAFGLRPATREMGRRLAAQGYAVLVPNPFYRVGSTASLGSLTSLSFSKDAERSRLMELMGSVTRAGAAEKDAQSYLAFLSGQAAVNPAKKMGVQGYCMGGGLAIRTGAVSPDRIGAIATFHGGGLVSDKPDSPHKLAPRLKAQIYVAVAGSDDQEDPEEKNELRKAFADASLVAEIEVYSAARHGWCMPDLAVRDGQRIYAKVDAEHAWEKLLALYRNALA